MKPYDFAREFRVLTLRESAVSSGSTMCDTPDKAAEYWRTVIASVPQFNADQENFVVLVLNTRRRVTGHILVGLGTLDSVLVSPSSVFRGAIVANAAAVLLAHNHPSGISEPSEADIRVTRDLIRAGQLLKIEVVDHVIMGERTESERGWSSLRELGYFF